MVNKSIIIIIIIKGQCLYLGVVLELHHPGDGVTEAVVLILQYLNTYTVSAHLVLHVGRNVSCT